MRDNLQIPQNHDDSHGFPSDGNVHDMHANMKENDMHEEHTTHDMMMMMYFYFGYENVQMIIKGWVTWHNFICTIEKLPDGKMTGKSKNTR